jgi:hypothetical protein
VVPSIAVPSIKELSIPGSGQTGLDISLIDGK